MRTTALFGAKNIRLFEILVCPHGQGGLSQCGHFADNGGRGINFLRFRVDVFYGRHLIQKNIIIDRKQTTQDYGVGIWKKPQ